MLLNSSCSLLQHVKESALNKAEGCCCSAIRKQLSEDSTSPVFPTEISVALKHLCLLRVLGWALEVLGAHPPSYPGLTGEGSSVET